mmetsp:Transcript_11964/g.24042  ORF Transcript_11964/g.24042 Transcript_11964/m.24042 type:complete len:197 (-) Transcript_11964:280-870(-)
MDQDMYGWKDKQLQGDETVQKLRLMGFDTRVVMRTSSCTAESLANYTKAGADAVMPKSTRLKYLKAIIKSMLTGEEELVTRDAETTFFYLKTAEDLSLVSASPNSWNERSIAHNHDSKFMTPQLQCSRTFSSRRRSTPNKKETEHTKDDLKKLARIKPKEERNTTDFKVTKLSVAMELLTQKKKPPLAGTKEATKR